MNLDLEAVLRPFLDQSARVKTVVVIGCHWLCTENGREVERAEPVADRNDAVLIQLGGDGGANLAIVACIPAGATRGARPVHTFDSLARQLLELTKKPFGDHLIILPDYLLEELILPVSDDFGLHKIVSLSMRNSSQLSDANAWKLQRTLFDRGLVAIGCVQVKEGEARCFLVSDDVRSLKHLGIGTRGQVTMSSLGGNGRFANQLFQYSYLKLYALRHGATAALPEWEGKELFCLEDPSCAGVHLPRLSFAAFTDDDRMLWDMDEPPIDIDLWGYFQEIPRCWQPHRPLLRRMFTLSNAHERAINAWHYEVTRAGQRTLVVIHVRRGDYRDLQHSDLPWFRLVPEDWYLAWLRAIWPTLRDPALYLATDDERTFPIFLEFAPISAMPRAITETLADHIRDFEILRRADVLAISNSSFSRMASILAPPTQKCFCPSFQAQSFVPYQPWIDPGFWTRFADGIPPPSKKPLQPSLSMAARIAARSCRRWFRTAGRIAKPGS